VRLEGITASACIAANLATDCVAITRLVGEYRSAALPSSRRAEAMSLACPGVVQNRKGRRQSVLANL